ncbi:MAG: ribosome silencing factor [Muribaculaceae bacterium]|nr:ribosome silencing factor [Muribaculaceae bacterium]
MTKIINVITSAIQDKKGFDISILDLSDVDGAPTGQFIICSGKSTTQVSSIADNVREEVLKQTGEKPINYDGYRNSQWIVIDYGDTMVHVFLPEIRQFYRLEELWSDAETIHIEDAD